MSFPEFTENDTEEFKKLLLQKEEGDEKQHKLVIVDFHASWCMPCKKIKPKVEEWAKEYAATARFVGVDVDVNESVCEECNIVSMPTFIAFRQGNEVGRVSGAGDESQGTILEWLKKEGMGSKEKTKND